jgi:8-oxo-dGTP pyrophosphatase MutT (NUDIX family)
MAFSQGFGNRSLILKSLSIYKEKILNGVFKNIPFSFEEQLITLNDMCSFIQQNPTCFMRECLPGHITGSAFVVSSDFSKVLFTYHAKLKKWLQLGGHCDGDYLIHNAALREAKEESGLLNLKFLDLLNFPKIYIDNNLEGKSHPVPFDIDIHTIPERFHEPAHKHYDIRYLIVANENEDIIISEESLDLKWISIQEVSLYTHESSTLRQVEKFKSLFK